MTGQLCTGEQISRKSRLTPRDILPLRRAHGITEFSLYWLPVNSFPVPAEQRAWLLKFLTLLSKALAASRDILPRTFLQLKAIQPHLTETFLRNAPALSPLMGLSRRPGETAAHLPNWTDIRAIQEGKETFDYKKHIPNYCYWLRGQTEERQRELLFGFGGLTMLFLKPDPAIKVQEIEVPESLKSIPMFKLLLERFDVKAMQQRSIALFDTFFRKSKELFGADLAAGVPSEGLLFIVPLLSAGSILSSPAGEVKKWFDLFDVYITESPADGGILIAAKFELEQTVMDILAQLRAQEPHYPEK